MSTAGPLETSTIIKIVCGFEFVAIYVAIGIWRSRKSVLKKILLTAFIMIPIFGLIFSVFLNDPPDSLPPGEQASRSDVGEM